MRVEVVRTIHFEKNVKGLLKRYRSLESDLDVLISVIEKYPEGKFPVSFRLQGYPGCYFVKVKKNKEQFISAERCKLRISIDLLLEGKGRTNSIN